MHYLRFYNFNDHLCSDCKVKRRKEGFCKWSEFKQSNYKSTLKGGKKRQFHSPGVLAVEGKMKANRCYLNIMIISHLIKTQMDSASDCTLISKKV